MSDIADNRNIGTLFSKYELFFLDQAYFSSDPPQILILQFVVPRVSLSLSPSLSNLTLVEWNSSSTESLSSSSSVFLNLSYPFRPYALIIGYNKPYPKPRQSNLLSSHLKIIISYLSNTLPIKKLSLQEPLHNTVNNNSIFNRKCVDFFTKWQVLFHFHNPVCEYNHPDSLSQRSVVATLQLISLSLFCPYFFIKPGLQSPLILRSFIPHQFFISLFFECSYPYNQHQKYSPYLSHVVNSGCVKGPMSRRVLWEQTFF